MYNVSFFGSGETTGSVSKQPIRQVVTTDDEPVIATQPKEDTVCFRGVEKNDKKDSVAGKLVGGLTIAGLIVAGLACAHKYDVVGKLKDGKFKDYMRKTDVVTEPCHNACHKVKEFSIKYYNKVKDYFTKK